ncbi:MAG: hypothetical protein ACK6D7_14835, partial [Acidobacteriota bacterium]
MRTRQLLSKLPLNRRMWLAVGLLTLPVMASLYFVVSALQKDINFAARERAGVVEAGPLLKKVIAGGKDAGDAQTKLRRLMDDSFLILD